MAVDLSQGITIKMYEDALLGFILTDPQKMLETSEILPSADYFSDPDNRAAYGIFLKLFHDDRFPGDPFLTIQELYTGGDKQHFATKDEAGRYVNQLLNAPTDSLRFSSRYYRDYAEQIKWEKQRSDIKKITMDALAEADKISYEDREEFLGGIESRLGEITMAVHGKEGLKHISEMTDAISEQIDLLHRGEKLAAGVPTGIDILDKTLNGLKGGEVCVLAGRPAMGKTTLSMQITYNIAKMPPQDGKRNAVLIFSLEMMEDQLVSRMIATIGRVNMQQFMEESMHFVDNHYYRETYSDKFEQLMQDKLLQQYDRTQIALREIKELPIYPTTESGLSPSSIKSMVMQKKRELDRNNEKLSLIVIDYLQLMVPNTGKQNASRTEEVGDMSRKMKLLAKEFDVPVLLLAQLNRNADVTTRPNLKDLRESGSIEQDADKVIFIWSENADKAINDFGEYRDDNAKREALRREQQKVIISVAKNRQGECGDCPVIFDKGFQTFVSQSDEYSSSETFAEFAMKYYQKTRTDDIFWPLKPGEIDEDFEAYRKPKVREANYLTADGRLLTLADSEDRKTRMVIEDAPASVFPSEHMGSEAPQSNQPRPNAPKDRIRPHQPAMIDDLETGFEEIGEDELTDENDSGAIQVSQGTDSSLSQEEQETMELLNSAIIMDEDDEELDLDALDMLERLSSDLD